MFDGAGCEGGFQHNLSPNDKGRASFVHADPRYHWPRVCATIKLDTVVRACCRLRVAGTCSSTNSAELPPGRPRMDILWASGKGNNIALKLLQTALAYSTGQCMRIIVYQVVSSGADLPEPIACSTRAPSGVKSSPCMALRAADSSVSFLQAAMSPTKL